MTFGLIGAGFRAAGQLTWIIFRCCVLDIIAWMHTFGYLRGPNARSSTPGRD